MAEHDDSLEIGIAAGLDVPTALALSEQADDGPPRQPKEKNWNRVVVVVVIAGAVVIAVACLLR